MRTVELYRVYDAADRLLYVGITTNLRERLRSHSHRPPAGSAWWPQVAYCSLERFPEVWMALRAEVEAIHTEYPLYNKRSARPRETA